MYSYKYYIYYISTADRRRYLFVKVPKREFIKVLIEVMPPPPQSKDGLLSFLLSKCINGKASKIILLEFDVTDTLYISICNPNIKPFSISLLNYKF